MDPLDKATSIEDESAETEDDLRPEWAAEDDEIAGSAPDLQEIEGDTSEL